MPPRRLVRASAALAALDPVMAGLVERHGPAVLTSRQEVAGTFEGIARAIVFQQLAGKAAAAIFERVRAAVGGPLTATGLVATPPEQLRAAGLSAAKTASLLDLALRVDSGDLDLDRLGRLSDDAVIEALVAVRGIGRWTAEMVLMFNLGRLDVWPVGDLGVRKGYARAYGLEELPSPAELSDLGVRFSPYRSLAAWYCWRAAETVVPA